jgi:hypothetical protein
VPIPMHRDILLSCVHVAVMDVEMLVASENKLFIIYYFIYYLAVTGNTFFLID